MERHSLDKLSRALATNTTPWSRRSAALWLAAISSAGTLGAWFGFDAEAKKKRGKKGDHGAKSEKFKTKKKNKNKNKNRKRIINPPPPPPPPPCNPPLTLCGTQCVDTTTNATHCGGCGHACQAGETCAGGQCVPSSCPGGQKDCNGTCIPAGNCCSDGDCGSGATCQNGACACRTGTTDCGGACVNTNTDPNHCGGCGVTCKSGTCTNGQCTATGAEFRITVEGFKVWTQSVDDWTQLDGAGDEVFVQVGWHEFDGNGNEKAANTELRSTTIGDDFRQADRIQGGRASDLGGFKTGDVYPAGFDVNQPWKRVGTLEQELPGMTDIPWLVRDIKLRRGQGGVAITPTIWEYDGVSPWSFLQTWVESLGNNGGAIARAVWEFLKLPGEKVVADGVASLDDFILDAVGRTASRPIGLIKQGQNRYDFKAKTIVLDYDRAKDVVANSERGVVRLRYRDILDGSGQIGDPALQGDYELFLKVEELGPLSD